MLAYNAIGLLMLAGMCFRQDACFAAALVTAMLGFISTVALGLYLLRGEMLEPAVLSSSRSWWRCSS